jgi:cardiolipin synthase
MIPEFLHAHIVALISIFAALLHTLGIVSSAHALMTVRTSQGAIAWAMSLITFPYAALPLYWIFGRNKFQGYVNARRKVDQGIHNITESLDDYT